MRSIHELTDQEILALSEGEIARYVDQQCALEGIRLLPPMPVEPEPAPKPDTVVYTIGNYSFTNLGDAEKVLSALLMCDLVSWTYASRSGYQRMISRDTYEPRIVSEELYTAEYYDNNAEKIERYNDDMKEYTAKLSEYRAISRDRRKVEGNVMDCIRNARAKKVARDGLMSDLNRYIELAEGNTEKAVKLFRLAYNKNDQMVDPIVESVIAEITNGGLVK